jgi:hypothetical protein
MVRVSMPRCTQMVAVLSCLLHALPAFAEGRVSPVAVSADVVDDDPEITTRDFGGHKAWSIIWRRDAQGRELRVGFIEELRLPYAEHPQEMVDFAHDENAGAPVEQTVDLPGRAEQLWNREVFWLVMSEAALAPGSRKKLSGDRRTCAVFTADPAPRIGTLVGAYCRDLPPGTKVDEATARQWLDDIDLRVP